MSGLVLLASYPKSGNTWMRAWVASMINGGNDIDINNLKIGIAAIRDRLDDYLLEDSAELPWQLVTQYQAQMWREYAESVATPVYLKVHDAWAAPPWAEHPPLPADAVKAVIYISRDPRDVVPSYAVYSGKTIPKMITVLGDKQNILAGNTRKLRQQLPQFVGSWSSHAESWLDSGLPLLWVRYEDMVSAPAATFGRIARFLDLPADSTVLNRAIAATRFDRLQKAEAATGFRDHSNMATARFFRQGKVGGWQESLTAEQAQQIVKDHAIVMRRLGYLNKEC